MTDPHATGTVVEPHSSQRVEGLHRRLSQRQLTMMAIGGAIGVGLFLGSSVTIRLAGPAVIVSYLLGAGIALIMSYALAEMAVVHPVAGAFGVYAEKYLNRWAGYSVRATYGAAQIIAIGAEVTAAGIYVSFWFPNVPQWIWIVSFSAALVALNAMKVNRLGEFEYWFAMIKVTAILAFIVVGLCLIFGNGSHGATGWANLTQHGGIRMEGCLAVAHYYPDQLHGGGNHRSYGRRGRASGGNDTARNAQYRVATHPVLRAGGCYHRRHGAVEPGQQFLHRFRQPVCYRVRCSACSVCCSHHELRGADRSALQREHEPLFINANAVLAGSGRLCSAVDRQG